MGRVRHTHISLDLHLCSSGWHLCALTSKVPHFSELPLLAYTEGSWCLSPHVLSGLKILRVKGPVPQSVKAVVMDMGPCREADAAPLPCTPVSTLPRLRL